MDFPIALYKKPGADIETDGGRFGYMVAADVDAMDAAVADGWFLTSTEASEAYQRAQDAEAAALAVALNNPDAPPTRAELEQKATELGLKFDGRTSDKKLRDLIAATLEA